MLAPCDRLEISKEIVEIDGVKYHHHYGGGLVAETAKVGPEVRVGGGCRVYGNAILKGYVQLTGCAQVGGDTIAIGSDPRGISFGGKKTNITSGIFVGNWMIFEGVPYWLCWHCGTESSAFF